MKNQFSLRILKQLGFACLVLLTLNLEPCSAQICANPSTVIYGLSNSGNILPITVSNASVGATINPAYPTSSSNSNAIGYDIVNGLFYYFQNNSSGGSQGFVSFNPSTNTYNVLASAPITNAVNRGCVNFNGTGYYCLDQNGMLCYYNIPSNTWTFIGSNFVDQYGNNVSTVFQSQGSGDMAIDGLGNLWIVSSNTANYGVYEITAPLPTTSTASISINQLVAPTTATPAGVNFAGIAFSSTGQIYVCTPNDLYLMSNNYSLTHLGTFSVAGSGGDLTSCNYPTSVLPVSWQSVSATFQSNNSVVIGWIVDQQINSKEYTVERSADGKNWSNLGTLESRSDNTATQTYQFIDQSPLSGDNYYRIEETDMDGHSNYSVTKLISVQTEGKLAIWPNPANAIVHIQDEETTGSSNLNTEIFDQSGKKVLTGFVHSGINTLNIELLPPGFYIVHIALSNGSTYNQKLVKL
jgi:hypothetical protein